MSRLTHLLLAAVLLGCGGDPDPAAEDELLSEEVAEEPTGIAAAEPPATEPVEAAAPADDRTRYERVPTRVTLVVAGRPQHAGTYDASGISQICGRPPTYGGAPASPAWNVQFPDEAGEHGVRNLTLRADTLPLGGTTSQYYLALGLVTGQGRQPPSLVLDTGRGATGTVSLSQEGAAHRVELQGRGQRGEEVTLTIICTPGAAG